MRFGELLHLWRDRLSPADAGFRATTARRAPGLRREELAQLAGLSVDYVLRLEQGRATNPSAQVVGALARALQVSREERDQLYVAAGLLPPQDGTISAHVPAGIQRLVGRLGDVPIGVYTADWTLAWWNDLWTATMGDPAELDAEQRNLARRLFTTGLPRVLHSTRGDTLGLAIVADLQVASARYPADGGLARLVRELHEASPEFARLWAESVPAEHTTDRKIIDHPEVGPIQLDCDILLVPGANLRIVTYTTAANTPDATKLDLLRVTGGRSGVRAG
ncbi:helix-turn-helix transcriptional regulator [Kineosporia mesophila]|uniref:Helix-turn-helix transcriptional regulator n=1 Tax=Kineosporia mesophila TaxID=566012 RepID=A0ABP6Z1B6_9ACTN|nr:helix-turn-helix transcriptional regulator [Kineosporia mesophila]MCD5351861.1 helix-turn-helix transcriptional regulator [Kineosporia mesophila]